MSPGPVPAHRPRTVGPPHPPPHYRTQAASQYGLFSNPPPPGIRVSDPHALQYNADPDGHFGIIRFSPIFFMVNVETNHKKKKIDNKIFTKFAFYLTPTDSINRSTLMKKLY